MGCLGPPEAWGPWARAQRAQWIRPPWPQVAMNSQLLLLFLVIIRMHKKIKGRLSENMLQVFCSLHVHVCSCNRQSCPVIVIGKRVVDFLLVSIELFASATAEALRANVD